MRRLITFEKGVDSRCRDFKVPTVAKIVVGADIRYCVIGTQYGYIHTTGGDLLTWKSYSGARRAARNYVGL